jgi:hypothetical protein
MAELPSDSTEDMSTMDNTSTVKNGNDEDNNEEMDDEDEYPFPGDGTVGWCLRHYDEGPCHDPCIKFRHPLLRHDAWYGVWCGYCDSIGTSGTTCTDCAANAGTVFEPKVPPIQHLH